MELHLPNISLSLSHALFLFLSVISFFLLSFVLCFLLFLVEK